MKSRIMSDYENEFKESVSQIHIYLKLIDKRNVDCGEVIRKAAESIVEGCDKLSSKKATELVIGLSHILGLLFLRLQDQGVLLSILCNDGTVPVEVRRAILRHPAFEVVSSKMQEVLASTIPPRESPKRKQSSK